MPIYEYLCGNCGHHLELLQRMSDEPLTDCPACKKPELKKQISRVGFQLKGTGWYVTDFRDKGKPAAPKSESDTGSTEAAKPDAASKPDTAKDTGSESKPASGAETPAKPPAAASTD